MKANVTWKGEPGSDQKELAWGGTKFEKDKSVEVTDAKMIEKAKGNQFFEVQVTEEDEGEEKPETYRPPSNTMSPQHASPKPGERVGTQGAPTQPGPASKK